MHIYIHTYIRAHFLLKEERSLWRVNQLECPYTTCFGIIYAYIQAFIRISKIINDEYIPVISETYTLTCIALVVST